MIFLGERPDLKVFIGGFVILVGVSIILLGKIEKKS